MKKPSKTILFFGNERLATGVTTTTPTLQALIEYGYDIKAVVSSFSSGYSRNNRDLEISAVAHEHNVPLLLPKKLIDIKEQLRKYRANVGVLVAYGKIIPQEIIDMFEFGIINIHPSLLPLHRGPTPIESAILHGDSKTGVSIMQLTKAMDAGPVFAQSVVQLKGDEQKALLAAKLLEIGQAMLIDLLPDILSGKIVALPQDDSSATYDQRISKLDGNIDWNKPAEVIEREIRAYAEWPKSNTTFAGKDVIVTKAHLNQISVYDANPGDLDFDKKSESLGVATASGTLWIDFLKPAGKPEMSAKAFIAGYLL